MTPLPSRVLQTVRLGNYEPLVELASGGMATVYVARHVGGAGFERLVVIKRVHAHLLKDQAFTDMFRDEARMSSTIRHPNVVPVIDVVETGSELLLVLEYVESLSLSAMMRIAADRKERLPPAVVSRIVADTLAGLHAAHEAMDLRGNKMEMIHRDVSPQNVIVGLDGASRLIDFGIAKAASRITTTRDGVVKGKLRYMSPEQVRQKPLDRRADVFAAGVVLYEALTGEAAFPGEDAGDIAVGILLGGVPVPSSIVPELPAALDEVVAKALASDRDERYATAAEFQEALERALPPASPREVAALVESMGASSFARRRAELQAALEAAAVATETPTVSDEPTVSAAAAVPSRPRRTFLLAAVIGLVLAVGALAAISARRAVSPVANAAAPGEATATATATSPSPSTPTPTPTSPSTSTSSTATAASARATTRRPVRPPASADLHRRNPYGAP